MKKPCLSFTAAIGVLMVSFFFFQYGTGLAAEVAPPAVSQSEQNSFQQAAFQGLSLDISSFRVDKEKYSAGDQISGGFKLRNLTNYYAGDIYYKIRLHKHYLDSKTASIFNLDNQTALDYALSEGLTLAPKEEKDILFSYKIPGGIPSSEIYYIQIEIFGAKGNLLNNVFKKISIDNQKVNFIFLDEQNSKVFGKDRIYNSQEGPIFEYDKAYKPFAEASQTQVKNDQNKQPDKIKNLVKIKAFFKNLGEPINKIKINLTTYRYGAPLVALSSQSFNWPGEFKANSLGWLDLNLPLPKDPGSYETIAQLSVNGEKVSNPIGFRYVVKGDSGLIYEFLVEKINESNFVLNVLLAGSADFLIRDNKSITYQIDFSVKEKNGKTCFQKTSEINISDRGIWSMPFSLSNCSEPLVFDAKLIKDGKVLDTQQTTTPTKKISITDIKNFLIKNIQSIMIIFTLILIIAIIFLLKKIKNNPAISPLSILIIPLIIFGFGILGAPDALALSVPSLTSPVKGATIDTGTINFQWSSPDGLPTFNDSFNARWYTLIIADSTAKEIVSYGPIYDTKYSVSAGAIPNAGQYLWKIIVNEGSYKHIQYCQILESNGNNCEFSCAMTEEWICRCIEGGYCSPYYVSTLTADRLQDSGWRDFSKPLISIATNPGHSAFGALNESNLNYFAGWGKESLASSASGNFTFGSFKFNGAYNTSGNSSGGEFLYDFIFHKVKLGYWNGNLSTPNLPEMRYDSSSGIYKLSAAVTSLPLTVYNYPYRYCNNTAAAGYVNFFIINPKGEIVKYFSLPGYWHDTFSTMYESEHSYNLSLSGLKTGEQYALVIQHHAIAGPWEDLVKRANYYTFFPFMIYDSVPKAPSNISASGVECVGTDRKIKVNWQDNSDNEDGFKIYAKFDGIILDNNNPWTELGTVGKNITSFESGNIALNNTLTGVKIEAYSLSPTYNSKSAENTSLSIKTCPPTLFLSANPTTIDYGNSTVLSWTPVRADSCLASGNWSNAKQPVPYSETITGLTSNSSFTLTCSNPAGSVARTASVSVNPKPTLSASLLANPSSGPAPLNSTLSASVSGTALGTINYKFDCNNDGTYEQQINNTSNNPQTTTCNYPNSGAYTAKVYVERGTASPATATTVITVTEGPPAAPTNFRVVNVSSCSSVDLQWVDNSNNETGFKIERATNQSGPWTPIGATSANATTYSDAGLIEKTTYYYKIKAFNSVGDSTYSSTQITMPSCSGGLNLSGEVMDYGGGELSAFLRWNISGNRQNNLSNTFDVFRIDKWVYGPHIENQCAYWWYSRYWGWRCIWTKKVTVVGWGLFNPSPGTFWENNINIRTRYQMYWNYSDSNVQKGEKYKYQIVDFSYNNPYSPSGPSTSYLSNEVIIEIPFAPTLDLSAKPTTVDYGNSTVLSWTPVRADSCLASGNWSNAKQPVPYSETITGLTSNSSFTLTCSNPAGSVARTASVSVNPKPTLSASLSANPSSGAASLNSTLSASVSGTALGTINYKFDCNNDGTYEQQINNTSNNPQTTTCNYPNSGAYTAKVYVERGTASPATATTAITVTDTEGCPADVAIAQSAVSSCSNVNLSWTDSSSNEEGFKIYRSTSQTGPWGSPIATVASNPSQKTQTNRTIQWNDTTVSANTWYYYKIISYNNSCSPSPTTSSASAYIPSCADKVAVSGYCPTCRQVKLQWFIGDLVVAKHHVQIYKWVYDYGWYGIFSYGYHWDKVLWDGVNDVLSKYPLNINGTSVVYEPFYDNSVSEGKKYAYRVDGCSNAACSSPFYSSVFYINTPSCPNSPTLEFNAKPANVPYGGSSVLEWSSVNTDSCSASDEWYGPRSVNGSEPTGGNLISNKTYTLTCVGLGGSLTKSITVTVGAAPVPTADIKANNSDGPIAIDYNSLANITWSSTNSSSCSVSPTGWTGLSGSNSTGNLTSSKTYTLTCTGITSSASDSVVVNVNPPPVPTADIKANSSDGPITIDYNSSANITWSSANSSSCSVSPTGWTGTSGSNSTGNLTSSKTYTLTCTGIGGSVSDTVRVNVPDPDFSILSSGDISATTIRGRPGESTKSKLTIVPLNGFSSSVSFEVQSISPDLPGATYNFSPSSLNSSQYSSGSQFKVNIGKGLDSSKVYTIIVKGVGGGLTRTAEIHLNVQVNNPTWIEI